MVSDASRFVSQRKLRTPPQQNIRALARHFMIVDAIALGTGEQEVLPITAEPIVARRFFPRGGRNRRFWSIMLNVRGGDGRKFTLTVGALLVKLLGEQL